MVPREGNNMDVSLSTHNGENKEMSKGIGQETNPTTAKPMPMLSTSNYNEENKRLGGGGKQH